MNETKPWKSIARWPVKAGVANNESTDDHYTEAEARGVCKLLRANGYGGDGDIFPTGLYIAHFKDGKLTHADPYP